MNTSILFRRLLPVLSILALGVMLQPTVVAQPHASPAGSSEIRLDASLIKDFLEVIYFGEDGRFHFREYSPCSYQFLQNPSSSSKEGWCGSRRTTTRDEAPKGWAGASEHRG